MLILKFFGSSATVFLSSEQTETTVGYELHVRTQFQYYLLREKSIFNLQTDVNHAHKCSIN